MICWIVQFLKECSCLKLIRGIPALNQEGLFLIPMNVGRVDREGQRIECLSPISRLPKLQDELAQATQNFSKRFGRSQFLVARTVPGCLREIKNRQKFRRGSEFCEILIGPFVSGRFLTSLCRSYLVLKNSGSHHRRLRRHSTASIHSHKKQVVEPEPNDLTSHSVPHRIDPPMKRGKKSTENEMCRLKSFGESLFRTAFTDSPLFRSPPFSCLPG